MRVAVRAPVARHILVLAAALAMAGCASSAATPVTIYVTLPPKPTAQATPTPQLTPEATLSPTTETTASPSSSPTSPAAACTGSLAHQAYFVQAAQALPWDVYCAVLPSTWWLQQSEFTRPDGGRMYVVYRNNAGDMLVLQEGKLCEPLATCMDGIPIIGAASFGGLAATTRSPAPGVYFVAANPHSLPGYMVFSNSLSQAKVVQYAAAVVKVSKPTPAP